MFALPHYQPGRRHVRALHENLPVEPGRAVRRIGFSLAGDELPGPRTLAQWQDYLPALDYAITAEDEAFVDSLVKPGHPSTAGYTDPAYPLAAR